jgi:hypothetical protein
MWGTQNIIERVSGSLHKPSNSLGDVFHIGGLQSRPASAEHRIGWQPPKEVEHGGEKRVFWSEHHRRPDRNGRHRARDGIPNRFVESVRFRSAG